MGERLGLLTFHCGRYGRPLPVDLDRLIVWEARELEVALSALEAVSPIVVSRKHITVRLRH